MITRGTRTLVDHFDRAQAFTTTPGQNGWTIADTSSAGAPTYLAVTEDGGAAALTMAADSEAEILTLYHNDVLAYDVRLLQRVWWIVKVAGIDSVTTLVVGVGSARNDTADSVATNAWFRIQGSVSTSNLLVETDDAVTDNDDNATGTTLSSTYKKLEIDFTNGISDVRFLCDGARVGAGETYSLGGLTAGLNVQPMVMLQKASGTGVGAVTIAQFGVTFDYAYGA